MHLSDFDCSVNQRITPMQREEMARRSLDNKIERCFVTAEEKIKQAQKIKNSEHNILKDLQGRNKATQKLLQHRNYRKNASGFTNRACDCRPL